jgi:flagellar biogenesis protein FliO
MVALLLALTVAASPLAVEATPDSGTISTTSAGAPVVVPTLVPEPELPKSEPPELAAEELNLGWALVRTVVVLGLVIGLAYLILNVGLRKLLGIRPSVGAKIVTILERVTLDQKRSLFVIEAAGEVLLVGGAEGTLALISKLDAAEVARLRAASPPESAVQLSPLLQKLLGRKDVPPSNR